MIIVIVDVCIFSLEGLYVMQTSANQSNRKEFIVSFTEIGVAFRVIASAKVLNILPVVGNTSLAG